MNILRDVKWQFPPRVRKCGTPIEEHDVKELIIIQSDHFGQHPVIAMSDIHAQTQNVIDKLDQKFLLSRFVVLTAGDMAGTLTMGTDGDPTAFYQQLSDKCQEFYFVQGNHDMPDKMNVEKKLTTVNGTPCMIPNGQTINTSIGKIGGVNGIISDKHHPYKLSESDYLKHLTRALEKRPSILLTHDTPALPSLIGNQ
jgi:predicted phosphodiesterase